MRITNKITHTPYIFSGLDLSAVPDGGRLLQRYEMWFERYPHNAKEALRKRLANGRNVLGAWFELLLHELFTQLGCKVEVEDIDNAGKIPDFLVSHGNRNCYVEATTVNPKDNPSEVDHNLDNALRILNSLDSADFQIRLIVEGRIPRTLSKKELMNTFEKLLSEYDPVMTIKKIQQRGKWAAPSAEIKGENWKLRGELVPISLNATTKERHRELIVGPMGSYMGDASPQVQDAITEKARKYGVLDAPLIVAANVLDVRFNQEAEVAALFGQEQIRYFPEHPEIPDQLIRKPDGIWVKGGYKPRYTRLTGVIMFRGFFPWNPQGSVCLYLNPFIDTLDLPEHLYRLTHAIGKDGRLRRVEGIDVETLLATEKPLGNLASP